MLYAGYGAENSYNGSLSMEKSFEHQYVYFQARSRNVMPLPG